MIQQTETLEEMLVILTRLRNNPMSRRKFPKEVWDSIIRLTQIHPIEQICDCLKLHPAYLKEKIHLLKGSLETFDFQEVSHHSPNICTDTVVIELMSASGLKARIQGSPLCLNYLTPLFKG